MKKEIVRCSHCDRIVSRTSWVSLPVEVDGVFKGKYWCKCCQKAFTFIFSEREITHSWTLDGYILIKIPGIGWIKEHKYVWEKEHGLLPQGFVIHHINGDKADNRLENLIAISKKAHSRLPSTNDEHKYKARSVRVHW